MATNAIPERLSSMSMELEPVRMQRLLVVSSAVLVILVPLATLAIAVLA